MRRRLLSSLRARSLIAAAVGVILSLALSGAVIWTLFSDAVERQFDERFNVYLNIMAAAMANGPDYRTALSQRLADGPAWLEPRFGQAYGGVYWVATRLVAGEGATDPAPMVFRSVSLWDAPLHPVAPLFSPLGETRFFSGAPGPGGTSLRAAQRRVRVDRTGDEWLLIAAADERSLAMSLSEFRRGLTVSLTVLGLALLAAAAAQGGFVLSPLGAFRQALADYRAGRSARIEGVYPTEIAPLVEDLNGLLDRNERLIAQGRRRAADLAHEMKTPVAVLRNELDLMAEREAARAPQEGEEAASGVFDMAFDALAQIERQTRRQLARSRVGAMQRARAPLRPAAERLRRTLLRLHRRDLKIRLDLPEDLVFRGDEEDLEELLGELMNNACVWARAEVAVAAEAVETPQGARLALTIEDDGPGAEPDQHARMLAAGGRLDSRRPGSGIGLAMVADLVEAYDGELVLDRAAAGGLQARLLLPGGRAA